MFYYFGRKKALASLYPAPSGSLIIEPFAGSAAYSLHADHWERDVMLVEADDRIIMLWRYLQEATSRDIESLPALAPGDLLSAHRQLSAAERLLISLHIGPGKNRTNDVVSKFSRWTAGQRYIAGNIHKIKHWSILHANWPDVNLPNGVGVTWFIDPPYQRSGRLYRCRDVDYARLGSWVTGLDGQVIVCEQEGADWLPFEPLASLAIAGRNVSHEVAWWRAHKESWAR